MAMTTGAAAQGDCSDNVVEFADYLIGPAEEDTNRTKTTFVSKTNKPI